MYKYKISIIVIMFLIASCAPKSKTINPLTKSESRKINNLAVYVDVEDYKLKYSGNKNVSLGIWANGTAYSGDGAIIGLLVFPVFLVSALIEKKIRDRSDNKRRDRMQDDIEYLDPNKLFSEKLQKDIQSNFQNINLKVTDTKSPKSLIVKGFDVLLEVKIEKWKMVDSVHTEIIKSSIELSDEIYSHNLKKGDLFEGSYELENEGKKIQEDHRSNLKEYGGGIVSIIESKAKIIDLKKNKVMWERKEVYKSENVRLRDINDNPYAKMNILSSAINQIAVNTVNEIQISQ